MLALVMGKEKGKTQTLGTVHKDTAAITKGVINKCPACLEMLRDVS